MNGKKFKSPFVVCACCGTTSRDGDPKIGIPYPVIEMREEAGCELLCDGCLADVLKEEQKTKAFLNKGGK